MWFKRSDCGVIEYLSQFVMFLAVDFSNFLVVVSDFLVQFAARKTATIGIIGRAQLDGGRMDSKKKAAWQ